MVDDTPLPVPHLAELLQSLEHDAASQSLRMEILSVIHAAQQPHARRFHAPSSVTQSIRMVIEADDEVPAATPRRCPTCGKNLP